MSWLLAQSVGGQGVEFTSAFGGAAEVHDRTASAAIDANDPSATLAVHRGNGFDAGLSPYQSTRLSRYNAVALSLGADMRRREFITLLGGATAAWPLAARAQQPGKPLTIGFLGANTASAQSQWTAAFVQRLRELGWIEGRTVAIEYRWGEGRSERMAEIAAEFVQLKVDIIVTGGTAAVIAAKQATSVIPIIFASVGDPIGNNLVASLARPGGNVTGLSNQSVDLAGKRVELLREIVPGLRRLAIMANVGNPVGVLEMGEVQAAARTLGLDVVASEIQRAEDIAPAIDALKGRADALYVGADAVVNTNRIRVSILALGARLPTMHGIREHVEVGGLLSYGPNFPDLFRRAADLVDKILRGAKPGDVPVEQPTKFDLSINLTTAKALGLAIPESFLLRADEVIE
jgi:putative tryptophan/tyrosine transport system substrate-binding protein